MYIPISVNKSGHVNIIFFTSKHSLLAPSCNNYTRKSHANTCRNDVVSWCKKYPNRVPSLRFIVMGFVHCKLLQINSKIVTINVINSTRVQYIRGIVCPIYHNRNTDVHTSGHKVAHCGIWGRCIVGFVHLAHFTTQCPSLTTKRMSSLSLWFPGRRCTTSCPPTVAK